jgi:hypothetical protein
MKRIRIVQAAIAAAIVVALTSCGPSRAYETGYYPRSESSISLIVGPSPGLVVTRDPYGRYYYRDPYGHVYWRGYDNRYYLDSRYVGRSYYQHRQYNDWRHYHNYNQRRR